MANKHPGYMTTFKERLSYWTYFIGQNIYYNITAAFISTYLAMQGVNLAKVAIVLLIVKIWDAVNDPIFGFIFDKVKFKNGQKSLPWLCISTALIPIVTIILFIFFLVGIIMPVIILILESCMLKEGTYSLSNFTLYYWIGEGDPNIMEGVSGIFLSLIHI